MDTLGALMVKYFLCIEYRSGNIKRSALFKDMSTEFKYDNYEDDFDANPSTVSHPQDLPQPIKTEPETVRMLGGEKKETATSAKKVDTGTNA